MGTHPSPLPDRPAAALPDLAYRALLDGLGEACLALDGAGRVLYANPACADLLGVAPAELVGRPLAAAVPDFAESAGARALAAGTPQEAQHARAGRSFYCRAYPAPPGAVLLIADATARRRHEEEAFQLQKLESLGRLAGGLAHDLNNLLVGVLMGADLLRRDLPADSEQLHLADLIKKAAERAAGLSRQMLLYAGKAAPARRPVALDAVAGDCLKRLAADLPGNVNLTRAFAPGLPPVEADPAHLAQLVTNLVLNAAEALGPRGGRVLVATGAEEENGKRNEGAVAHPSCFILPPAQATGHVYLEVSDDGCGMSADVLGRIFDPFFTTKGKGRGLGLCSVLGTVRAHGGGLRAGSTPGGGTTIRVLLPAAAGPAATEPRPQPPPPPPGRVVLLVEADAVVRGVTTRALSRLGLQVLSAADGREALELLRGRREPVSLILLDLGSAGPALDALRAERPNVPVVLTSAGDAAPTGAPPGAFLPKPYTVPALIEVIGRALQGSAP